MSASGKKRPSTAVRPWHVQAVCLALAAITFAVFGQTVHHDFINFDDNDYVYQNPVVAQGLTLKGIAWAFDGVHAVNWHPLTWLSHELDCQLFGLRPGGHHFTNVLIHAATAVALFLVVRLMTGAFWRSAFIAAVFAVHPLRVESVAWVAERKDVLSGLFFVLTVGAYARYARLPWSLPRYGLALALFVLGLLSKPMLVTLPLVLLLLDYWPLRRSESMGRLVIEKLPLLALSAASCAVTLLAQNSNLGSTESYSIPLRFANALVACAVYLKEMLYPVGLAVFYPYPYKGFPPWEVALAGTLLAVLSAVVFWQRRKQPWLWVGWLWYLIMLVPVLGIIQMGRQAHADRYTYLPQIGIYAAVTWLVAEWGEKWQLSRAAYAGLMCAVLAVLMHSAFQQTTYWQNSETLWRHALACTRDNDVAHFNLGAVLLQKGSLDDSIAEFQSALQIDPRVPETQYNLGSAFLEKGLVDDAVSHYQSALQLKPDFADAHFKLANVLQQKGQFDDAIVHYQTALQIKPGDADTHLNLAIALMQKGRADDAISEFEKALQIRPDLAQAHNNIGNLLMQKGRLDEAIAHFQMALQLRPDYARASVNLRNALQQKESMNHETPKDAK